MPRPAVPCDKAVGHLPPGGPEQSGRWVAVDLGCVAKDRGMSRLSTQSGFRRPSCGHPVAPADGVKVAPSASA
jgi:hypothetical protein